MENYLILIGFFIVVVYFGSLGRVVWYERKINFLKDELDSKIQEIKESGGLKPIAECKINYLNEEYRPKIERLERKRRYILDKLPFIKH